MIAFDGGEEIIGFFVFDEEASSLPLGMQGIGSDDLARDVNIREQVAQFWNFVGFPGDFLLRDGDSLFMQEHAEQMHLSSLCTHGTFEDFAINGHAFKARRTQCQAPIAASSASTSTPCKTRRMVGSEGAT